MKIRNRLIILFSLIALVPLLVVGLVSYFNAKNALERQILGGLESVSHSLISDITHLIQLRQEQCKELAGTFLTRQLESSGVNDSLDIAGIQGHIESIYEEMKLDPGSKASDINKATAIDIIGIWDNEGTIVANTKKELVGNQMPASYLQGVKENGSYFAGFQRDPLTGEDFLIFLQAIRDYEDEQFAGAVLLKVKAQVLNEITTNRAALGKTGEVYLVNKDYYMITESRFVEDAILNQKVETETAKKCLAGEETLGIYPDYRGISIVGSARYLKDMGWCLFVEVDEEEAFAPVYTLRNRTILIGLIILALSIIIAVRIAMSFSRPISQAVKIANDVAQGDMTSEINISGAAEINELGLALAGMQRNMQEISAVAVAASGGDYDQNVEVSSEKDQLARSINKMMANTREKLWEEKGIGEMALELRGENQIQTLAENVINQLVPYLGAQVGAFYVLDVDENILKFTAGYAFKNEGRTNYDIQVGEGLVGQAAKEHRPILFTDVPQNYMTVNSALGESTPKNIIAVPLVANDQLKGVIEIGSVNEFTEVQQQLLQNLTENITIAINTAKSRNKIQELLKESQAKNEELQASEEELRSQQEELERIKIELDRQIGCMNEAALVSITDPKGDIIYANDMFCKISKYSREELMGKNHRILKSGKQPDGLFVGMWKSISMGRVWKGEICNKARDGSFYWVGATITPLKGMDGKIEKYVAVRFDITQLKLQQEEMKEQAALLELHTQGIQEITEPDIHNKRTKPLQP